MQITLKKFSEDPKHIIRKAPLIIVINNTPSYAVIPYAVYKAKYAEKEPSMQIAKKHWLNKQSRLYKLLFT